MTVVPSSDRDEEFFMMQGVQWCPVQIGDYTHRILFCRYGFFWILDDPDHKTIDYETSQK